MKLNATEVKGVFDHCFKALLDHSLKKDTLNSYTSEYAAGDAHKLTKAYINKLKELGHDLGPLDPRDGDNPYDVNAVGCSIWDPRCNKLGNNPFNWGPYVVRMRKDMLGKDGFSCGPW